MASLALARAGASVDELVGHVRRTPNSSNTLGYALGNSASGSPGRVPPAAAVWWVVG